MRQIKVKKKSGLTKSSGNVWVTSPQAKAQYKRVSAIGYHWGGSLCCGFLLYLAAAQPWEASEIKLAAIQNSEPI